MADISRASSHLLPDDRIGAPPIGLSSLQQASAPHFEVTGEICLVPSPSGAARAGTSTDYLSQSLGSELLHHTPRLCGSNHTHRHGAQAEALFHR